MAYNPPAVDCRYGAPMGRPNRSSFTDSSGYTAGLHVLPNASPFTLQRVRLDRGGYDSGGAYWGLGAPLYWFCGPLDDIQGYVRGATRDAAKAAVRAIHPHARFFR